MDKDQPIELSWDEPREIYAKMSKLTEIPLECIVGVSSKTGENFDVLVQTLTNLILKEDPVTLQPPTMAGLPFPKIYSKLKMRIDEFSTSRIPPLIELSEFKEIAKQLNIIGETLNRALVYLHVLGFCCYYYKEPV